MRSRSRKRWDNGGGKSEVGCGGILIEVFEDVEGGGFVGVREEGDGDGDVDEVRGLVEDVGVFVGRVGEEVVVSEVRDGGGGEVVMGFVIDEMVEVVEVLGGVEMKEVRMIEGVFDVVEEDVEEVRGVVVRVERVGEMIGVERRREIVVIGFV